MPCPQTIRHSLIFPRKSLPRFRQATGLCLLAVLLLAGCGEAPSPEANHRPDPVPPEPAYRLETLDLPPAMSPEVSAIAFSPDGELFAANRHGDIWRTDDPDAGNWSKFASGLHEPLGLLAASSRVAYVVHRPGLVRVEDRTGDGKADTFASINESWGLSGNYHEFAYGLVRDADGNFFGGLGLDSGGESELRHIKWTRGPLNPERFRRERQWSLTPYRGWSFKITPDGEFVPWAMGFRQPAGIGINPEGEFFSTDNQGDWMASSALVHHRKGHFYGHPASLKWAEEDFWKDLTDEELGQRRTPYAVILPHGALGGSPGEPVWDQSGGRFGPFEGQAFIGDFSPIINRVFLEKIDGEYQGAAFPFLRHRDLRQGNMRAAFSPDGVLYMAQTSRGWGVGEGLQRIVWEGETPTEIHSVRLLDDGFSLRFTVPMDPAALARPETYRVSRFRYLYHDSYGSPRIDEMPVEVTGVQVFDDSRQANLSVAELLPGYVYEFQLDTLASADGKLLAGPTAYYTANRLHNGDRFTGPFTRPILEPAVAAEAREIDIELGESVYRTYCMACHQGDGRGDRGASIPDFIGQPHVLGQSDAELLRSIRLGTDGGMAPFGAILTEDEMRAVLAYIRDNFDPQRRRGR